MLQAPSTGTFIPLQSVRVDAVTDFGTFPAPPAYSPRLSLPNLSVTPSAFLETQFGALTDHHFTSTLSAHSRMSGSEFIHSNFNSNRHMLSFEDHPETLPSELPTYTMEETRS